MLVDFGDISRAVELIVDRHLDHYCLNDSLALESPTTEEVARWVYRCLGEQGLPLAAVTIEETCTSVCTYRP
jgi:6-pyruvoyltetrahydropterin/6-carboxytetrahydropterin synthase